jgi:hypothetical protein
MKSRNRTHRFGAVRHLRHHTRANGTRPRGNAVIHKIGKVRLRIVRIWHPNAGALRIVCRQAITHQRTMLLLVGRNPRRIHTISGQSIPSGAVVRHRHRRPRRVRRIRLGNIRPRTHRLILEQNTRHPIRIRDLRRNHHLFARLRLLGRMRHLPNLRRHSRRKDTVGAARRRIGRTPAPPQIIIQNGCISWIERPLPGLVAGTGSPTVGHGNPTDTPPHPPFLPLRHAVLPTLRRSSRIP